MEIQALEKVKKLIPDEDYKALAGIIGKDVVALGENEAFALKDNEGEIRAFKQKVTLSKKEGTLIQPVKGGPFVISAQGYEVWAEAAGACVIFPKEVLVGGNWHPNPHVERDATNRRILAVHARAVAFRFSSKGIPQVSDWSTIFDTPSYRMIDLLAKAKSTPQAFRLLPEGNKPKDEGTWAAYPFDESITLWINTSHDEALKWFSQILNREKKALDFAQTFAKRNALKHLSGLQKAPDAYWTLSVLCWRPTSGNIIKWDATQYIKLQDKVGSLIQGTGEDFAPGVKQIESQAGKERVSDEEGYEGIEKEIDPEDQEPIEIEKEEPAPQHVAISEPDNKTKYSDNEQKIIKNYEVAIATFPDEHSAAIKELGFTNKTISIEDMVSIVKKISAILDEQAV